MSQSEARGRSRPRQLSRATSSSALCCPSCKTWFSSRSLVRKHIRQNKRAGGCHYSATSPTEVASSVGAFPGSGDSGTGGGGGARAEDRTEARANNRHSACEELNGDGAGESGVVDSSMSGLRNVAPDSGLSDVNGGDEQGEGSGGEPHAARGGGSRSSGVADRGIDDYGNDDDDDDGGWAVGSGSIGEAYSGGVEEGDNNMYEASVGSSESQVRSGGVDGSQQSTPPVLEDIHKHLGGEILEGGDANVRFNEKALRSDYYPYQSLTEMLMFVFVFKHQLSRVAVKDLFAMLRVRDGHDGDGAGNGQNFDVADVPRNEEHFVRRLRKYLPLLEVIHRTVPTKADGKTASVYDIPLNLQYARFLRSKIAMKEMQAHPGGRVLRGVEATTNRIGSDHVFAGPVERVGRARSTFMDGELSRRSPFFGFDGVLCRGGRRVYVGEIVMAAVCANGNVTDSRPCRILSIFWDAEVKQVCVTVRCFRYSEEVLGRQPEASRRRSSVTRIWEEQGDCAERKLQPGALKDLCEVVTIGELAAKKHKDPWPMGERRSPTWTFVCEGFVKKRDERAAARRRRKRGRVVEHTGGTQIGESPFEMTGTWVRGGGEGESFPNMRGMCTYHNVENLPFCGVGTVINIDAFNVWSITNSLSEGGTYATMACLSPALQRLQRHLHVTTVAEAGAAVEGEMALSCGVLGSMEKGCLAHAWVTDCSGEAALLKVFFRGGLFLVIADSPQRAVLLNCKHPNRTTKHPCPYCKVTQSGEDGGDLGDPAFDIVRKCRTRGHYDRALERLGNLAEGSSQQTKLSRELGVVPRRQALPSPMYELVSAGEVHRRVPPEMLHVDALNHLGLVQPWFLNLLNSGGQKVVSSIIRQRDGGLHHPGAVLLKDPITHYTSYTGSHKWTFGSIMLIVFRPVLQDVTCMGKYLKSNRIKDLEQDGLYSKNEVVTRLRQLLQASSALSFAIRSPVWRDGEIAGLADRVEDWMAASKNIMGSSEAVRPSMHSLLHLPQAVRDVGRMPDASVGEHGHQLHKRSNASGSGRDPAAHHIRRVNTRLALDALADGTPWKAIGRDRVHGGDKVILIHPGAGCTRMLSHLRDTLRGGLASPSETTASGAPSEGNARSRPSGDARWRIPLWTADSGSGHYVEDDRDWQNELSTSYMRPDEGALLAAYKKWYGCQGRGAEARCEEMACPYCWTAIGDGGGLDIQFVECSRYFRGAPRVASSGTGRWIGGNVKAAGSIGGRNSWAFGAGSGENVEIFTSPGAAHRGDVGVGKLTMGKMLYFFEHEGNYRSEGSEIRPVTKWVAAYEYVSAARGSGNHVRRDPATKHPVFGLRGQAGRPSVFPVAAIRRHVSLAHACTAGHCGPRETSPRQAGPVWRHRLRLASSHDRSMDWYLLNEHQHSICRPDTFL